MDEFTGKLLVARWQQMLDAVSQMGGSSERLCVERPAALGEVQELEQHLGFSLPPALRDILLTFSRKVEVSWRLPDDYQISEELQEIFGGDCRWSVERLAECHDAKQSWVREVFPDRNSKYDAVWHEKLAFQDVGNGDYLAIDIGAGAPNSVVYLSHDDGEGHGRQLGADFRDFLLRWSRVGCVGAEDWQWMPFAPTGGYLDPDCNLARLFRNRLGVNF